MLRYTDEKGNIGSRIIFHSPVDQWVFAPCYTWLLPKILRSFSWSWMRLNYIPPVDVSVKHSHWSRDPPPREFRSSLLRTLTSGWREQSRRPSGSWWSCSRTPPKITRSFTQVRPECALEIETAGRMAHLPRHHSSLVQKGATKPRIRLPVRLGLRMAMFEIPLLWISV